MPGFGVMRKGDALSVWEKPSTPDKAPVELYTFSVKSTSTLRVDTKFDALDSIGNEVVAAGLCFGAGDADGDEMKDSWELAQNDGSTIDDFLPSDPGLTNPGTWDFDGDGVSNLDEYLHGTDSTVNGASTYSSQVSWVRLRGPSAAALPIPNQGGISLAPYQASFTANTQDAQSHIPLQEAGGSLAFKFRDNKGTMTVGLGERNRSATAADIDYQIDVTAETYNVRINLNDVLGAPVKTGKYDSSSWFRLVADKDNIKFYKDDELLHTEPRKTKKTLWVDVAIGAASSALEKCYLYSTADLDADGLVDTWERGIDGLSDQNASLANFVPKDSNDGSSDASSNAQEFAMGTKAGAATSDISKIGGINFGKLRDVTWTFLQTGLISSSGSSTNLCPLTKVGVTSTVPAAASAVSNEVIKGDGAIWFQFKSFAPDPGKALRVGLRRSQLPNGSAVLDDDVSTQLSYSIALDTLGFVKAYSGDAAEDGGFLGVLPSADNPDVTWGLVRVGGRISVWQLYDGIAVPLFEFPKRQFADLIVDTAFITNGARLESCKIWRSDDDGDGIDDRWEGAYWTSLTGASESTNADGNRFDIEEFREGTNPMPEGGTVDASSVSWTRLRNSVLVENNLRPTAASNASDAQSSKAIVGTGAFTFQMSGLVGSVVGLNESNERSSSADIDFGFETIASTGEVYAWENGKRGISLGNFVPGSDAAASWFRLSVEKSKVVYAINGVVIHEVTRTSDLPLWVDASFAASSSSAVVVNPLLFSSGTLLLPENFLTGRKPVTWTTTTSGLVNFNTVGLSLMRTATASAAYTADARSTKKILVDGGVSFSIKRTALMNFMVGLNPNNKDSSVADIKYGVWIDNDGDMWACHEGIPEGRTSTDNWPVNDRSYLGKWTANNGVDSPSISLFRKGGKVTVWIDQTPLYEFKEVEEAPLFVDTSFSQASGSLSSCELIHSTGDLEGDGLLDSWQEMYFGGTTAAHKGGPEDDKDDDHVTNEREFILGTDPGDALSRPTSVKWVRLRNSSVPSEGELLSAAGVGDGQGHIALTGDGVLSFQVPARTKALRVGLTSANDAAIQGDVEYGFDFTTAGTFKWAANGKYGAVSPYYPESFFQLRVVGSTIQFYVDGVERGSAPRPGGMLWVDTWLGSAGAKVTNVHLYSKADVDGDGLDDDWERSEKGGNLGGSATYAELLGFAPNSNRSDDDLGLNRDESMLGADAAANDITKTSGITPGTGNTSATFIHGDGAWWFKLNTTSASTRTLVGFGSGTAPSGTTALTTSHLSWSILLVTDTAGNLNAWALDNASAKKLTSSSALPTTNSATYLGKYSSSAVDDGLPKIAHQRFGLVRREGRITAWLNETPLWTFPVGETNVLFVGRKNVLGTGPALDDGYILDATSDADPIPTANGALADINWVRHRGSPLATLAIGSNKFSRSAASSVWDTDAQSSRSIKGNGWFTFRVENNAKIAAGLTAINDGPANNDLEYGIQTLGNNRFKLVVEGKETGEFGSLLPYSPPSTTHTSFAMHLIEDEVRFVQDGTIFYTAKRSSANMPLWPDVSVQSTAGIDGCKMQSSGDLDHDGMLDEWEESPKGGGVPSASFASQGNQDSTTTQSDGGATNAREFAYQSDSTSTSGPNRGALAPLATNSTSAWNASSGPETSLLGLQGDFACWFQFESTPAAKASGYIGLLRQKLTTTTAVSFDQGLRLDANMAYAWESGTYASGGKNQAHAGKVEIVNSNNSAGHHYGLIRRNGVLTLWWQDNAQTSTTLLHTFARLNTGTVWLAKTGLKLANVCSTLVDSDSDGLADEWEMNQYLPDGSLNNSINSFGSANMDNDTWSDLLELAMGSAPGENSKAPEAVKWIKHRFTRSSNTAVPSELEHSLNEESVFYGDAESSKVISGDGSVIFSLEVADESAQTFDISVGFNTSNSKVGPEDLDFAYRLVKLATDATPTLSIYEGDPKKPKLNQVSIAAGLEKIRFIIRRVGSQVSFYSYEESDGLPPKLVHHYSSLTSSEGNLSVDAALANSNARIASCHLFGAVNGESVDPVGTPPLTALDWVELDTSPELFIHSALDQFYNTYLKQGTTEETARRIANFVFNEIELVDALADNERGITTETSLNDGGINRSAVGVFLERQGSPKEQCALLVYLLRKAGVRCSYLFPQPNTMQLTDKTVSTLLRMQVRAVPDGNGTISRANKVGNDYLISTSYPWVAAYVEGKWVHLFPWLKDVELKEGASFWDHVPSDEKFSGSVSALSEQQWINSPLRWLDSYISKVTPSNSNPDSYNHHSDYFRYTSDVAGKSPLEVLEKQFSNYLARTNSGSKN